MDYLLDEDSKLAFKYFQGFSNNISQQPFILFLTKKDVNPKISDLFQFITNEFFDKRNVYALKYPKNKGENEKINNFFIRCMKYYHQIGNDEINSSSLNTFNILLFGRAGVGKSTFINQFMHEKIAKEGEELLYKITNYIHPKYPIRIIETPGYEDENTVKLIKRHIEILEKEITGSNNYIDIILYFIELCPRIFFKSEIDLIKWLIEENKTIIFVVNDFKYHKQSDKNKFYENMKVILENIISRIPKNKQDKINKENILNNIIIINLQQFIYKYEDENEDIKTIIKQCYGMDILFKKIYDLFIEDKISFDEIENTKNINEIMNKIQKYKSLEKINDFTYFHLNIK